MTASNGREPLVWSLRLHNFTNVESEVPDNANSSRARCRMICGGSDLFISASGGYTALALG